MFLYSKDGNFVWNDKKEEIKDAWLDDIDWVKVWYNYLLVLSSVVDPYLFFPDPDPDPEFDVGDQYGSGFRIRIQYGSRALMTKN